MTTKIEKLLKITNSQSKILSELRPGDGLPSTITQLANRIGMDKANVSKDVKKLKELRLVGTDERGRETFVYITSEGWELFKEPKAKVIRRSFEDILARAENTADDSIGKRLRLPPISEVRSQIEKELKFPPLEALFVEKPQKDRKRDMTNQQVNEKVS